MEQLILTSSASGSGIKDETLIDITSCNRTEDYRDYDIIFIISAELVLFGQTELGIV